MKRKGNAKNGKGSGLPVLPFTVGRGNPGTLVSQLADGIRQAIRTGRYKAGETLPTLKELAAMSGTSLRVPREALERLKREGLVDPRKGGGSVVMSRGGKRWRGHILFVLSDAYGSYYANVFAGTLQDSLGRAGYLFTRATVTDEKRGAGDGALDSALAYPVDLAVIFCGKSPRAAKKVARHGVPFIEIASRPSGLPSSRGFVKFDREAALGDFARHCAERGIRRVTQACFVSEGEADASGELRMAGIETVKETFTAPSGPGRIAAIQTRAMERFEALVASGGFVSGGAYLFTDDFLAAGAIQALSAAGLTAPRDFKMASYANVGFGPVYPRRITALAMDPKRHGETAAQFLLRYLDTGVLQEDAALKSVFLAGETL